MDSNTRKTGRHYEMAAAVYLTGQGIRILERNYISRFGEIDLIGRDGKAYVFFEVKYRSGGRYGSPADAVGYEKQRKLSRTADAYCLKQGISRERSFRFDIISILDGDITWYRNAFEYIPGKTGRKNT